MLRDSGCINKYPKKVLKQLGKLEKKAQWAIIDGIEKCSKDLPDILKKLDKESLGKVFEQLAKSENLSDALSFISIYGEDAAKIFAAYGDDAVKAVSKCDNKAKAIEVLTKVTTKECAKFISTYGDDAVDVAMKKMNATGTDDLIVESNMFLKSDNTINWGLAPNDGRVPGTEKTNQVLIAGTYIDRYGPTTGNYTSPFGVPYEQRSLPYIQNYKAYHVYRVKKDINGITSSKIAKAFNGIGGGVQYELPNNIETLISNGYLEVVI